jgi:hypothetical protein
MVFPSGLSCVDRFFPAREWPGEKMTKAIRLIKKTMSLWIRFFILQPPVTKGYPSEALIIGTDPEHSDLSFQTEAKRFK